MNELFEEIYQSLILGVELVVATIISDRGSTPRTSGSRMIIYGDSKISGTIGGGAVEGDVMTTARKLFSEGGAVVASYDLEQKGNSVGMDLICGGRMQVLLELMSPSEDNKKMLGQLCAELKNGHPVCWIGRLRGAGGTYQLDRTVVTGNEWVGSIESSWQLQQAIESGACRRSVTTRLEVDNIEYLIEPVLPAETVYLIGGGHVSKEIAHLAKQIGFRTVVVDDREEYANSIRFPTVDTILISEGFAAVFEKFEITTNSYIVIVTRGHHFDKEVLAQALQTEAGYVGMIGSRRKRDTIYRALIEQGTRVEQLDRVFCPIGLSIAAETPAEIGVSVVAQLIQHRAEHRSGG